MGYKYFENKECQYYPCHNLKEINCLFCFCPLYNLDCKGQFKITEKGTKDCSDCIWIHKRENYDLVIEKLKG